MVQRTDTPQPELKLEPGDLIAGKYRVEAEIGSGGMGVVVAARHVAMGHRVAIKVLKLHDERDPHGAVVRFVREARAAARIQSDHVVRVLDVASLPDGTPYMVMEFLEGGDLRALLDERGELPIEEAVGHVLQACEGLAEAHASGVIHRDLKPSNLFIAKKSNGTEVLKILDFGISKVLPRNGEAGITTTGALMGSPLYMAPEQMRSSKMVDARADVWSVGLILYELLTGRSPFEGESIPEVCLSVMGADPVPIATYRRGVPAGLEAVILKCLAKERDNRFENMGTLARALEPYAAPPSRVHAERASVAVRTIRDELPALDGEEPVLPAPRPKLPSAPGRERTRDPDSIRASWSAARARQRKVKPLWVALGVFVSVAAITSGAFLARGSSSPSAPRPSDSASLAATTQVADPPPPATAEIPSVPFDSLPVAARDAGVAASRAVAQITRSKMVAPAAAPVVSAAPPPAAPHPAARSSSEKDAWKWGDRN